MAIGPTLDGRLVRLRAADVGDAARTIAIRNTPGFEVGLPRIPDDINHQQAWITRQRDVPDDYYFCVETLATGAVEGLIGLTAEPTVAGAWSDTGAWEWGRWASIASDPRIAIEAAALLIHFAMELGVPGVWGRVIRGNDRVAAFHERLGYNRTWSTETEQFFLAEGPHLVTLHRSLGSATPR
jgi:hypothetical protein